MLKIVGREGELASLRSFIEEVRGGPAALVLEGEAGIGKSTLWLAGVEHARSQRFRVLSTRPTEAERSLAHVGLGDLLEDILDDVLPVLPAPRRRALEAAMLRDDSSGDPVDHRALAVAVRDVLQLLSGQEPFLIAVDDVQWLDPSSSGTLAFALRRLDSSDARLRRWGLGEVAATARPRLHGGWIVKRYSQLRPSSDRRIRSHSHTRAFLRATAMGQGGAIALIATHAHRCAG